MKIGIISDAHLFHKHAITPDKYNYVLRNMDVDIIVDCGDLTDKHSLSAPQLDELSKVYNYIDKPIYIVSGNHDSLDNTTVASIFGMKKNIKIITEPCLVDDMLFVPFTGDMSSLYKKLDEIVKEPVDYAFSHLNITDIFFADIQLSNSKVLHKYASTWFNGHIHMPEENTSIYGSVYNVGACSSLTFGDSHIPNFCIFDTEKGTLTREIIEGSLVHITSKQSMDLTKCNKSLRYRYRVDLYNNPDSLEIRKNIREQAKGADNISEVVFSYIKDNKKKEQTLKQQQISKSSLSSRLVEHFEFDSKITLDNEIKRRIAGND